MQVPRSLLYTTLVFCLASTHAAASPPARNITLYTQGSSLDIDPCTQHNARGQVVPRGAWHHRRTAALWTAGEETAVNEAGQHPDAAWNFYVITGVKAPRGVRLQVCEPNFARMRDEGIDVCYDKTIVNVSALATGQSWAEDSFSDSKRYQMLRYSFEPGWGCLAPSDLSPGLHLSDASPPNSIEACPELGPHAAFLSCAPDATECCDFGCPADDYVRNAANRTCEPKCAAVAALACAAGERAAATCSDMTQPRYACAPCPDRPGFAFAAWSPTDAAACQYAACAAGSFAATSAGGCQPCPAQTFASSLNHSACEPCAMGTEAAPGQTACSPCFEGPLAAEGASCDPGAVLSRDAAALVTYLTTVAPVDTETALGVARAACDRTYACLPCTPGHFQSAPGTCTPCPAGSYQPSFQQTACIACAAHQTTAAEGASEATQCICEAGAE